MLFKFLYQSLLFHPACQDVLVEQSCPSPSTQKAIFPPNSFLSCCSFPLLSVVTPLFLGIKVRTTPSELKLLCSGWKEKVYTGFLLIFKMMFCSLEAGVNCSWKKPQNYGKAAVTKTVISTVTWLELSHSEERGCDKIILISDTLYYLYFIL